jgi:hypothetical protein
MNMTARNYGTPIYGQPFTKADGIRSAITLCTLYLAQASLSAGEVTAKKHAPLKRAEEKLAAARRFYGLAKARGASPEQLAPLAADGAVVGASVKAAAELVRVSVAEVAMKKLRSARALGMKGMNTREAARHVAEALLARGMFESLPSAMVGLAAEVSKEIDLPNAAPEHVLGVWMRLDPGA